MSLYSVITDDAGEEASLSDVLPDTDNVNPENIILNEEQEKLARKRLLGKLSRLEKEILSSMERDILKMYSALTGSE